MPDTGTMTAKKVAELTPDTRIHEMFLRLSAGEPSPV